ncbi:MAG: 50S ribosomal protein L25 [Anaerolineales bacterium]|nr:50S ribosomal protein L25 [Anaerolineales bacterium]MCB9127990.1 50S ribosomal protein L25 [Ardenticatenales bacterium]MCB9172006.1 50S ribosomal protein L25 [Ardenticatenales bacterium]
MADISLDVSRRETTGKAVKKLRRDGVIPIVVYGGPVDGALSLQANERELSRVLAAAGATQVVTLKVGGDSYPVLARVAQRHPTRHELMHVDFLAVDLTQTIQAQVPVHLVGEAPAAELAGAVILQTADELTVEALPTDIPQYIEVDITVLTEIGQGISVADLPSTGSYEIIADPETTLASVTAAAQEVEEEPEAGDELDVEYGEAADDAAEDDDAEADADDDA